VLSFHLRKREPVLGVESSLEDADYVAFGVPYDLTSSFRPGARYGPEAVRKLSANLEANSTHEEMDASRARVHDAGDIVFRYSLSKMMKSVYNTVRAIRSDGKVPLMLGGEHTFTFASVLAACREDSNLVLFDAHFDLRDSYLDSRWNHATYLRRLVEKRPRLHVAVIGVRGYDLDEIRLAREKGIFFYTPKQILQNLNQVKKQVKDVLVGGETYTSVDIDVLDPSYAPGVGNPEPGGLNTDQLSELLRAVCGPETVGLDVMEVCPLYDTGLAAAQAARVIVESITAIETGKKHVHE